MDYGSSELQEQSKKIVVKVTAIDVTTNSVDSELSPKTINDGDETSQLLFLDPMQIANAEKFRAEQLADISLERAWAQRSFSCEEWSFISFGSSDGPNCGTIMSATESYS